MSRISDIHSFMVPVQSADTTNYQYTEIVGGLSGCIITVNGVVVNVAAQSNIILRIRSLSGGVGCWVGGEKNDVYLGSQYLGSNNYYDDNINIDNNNYIDDYVDDYIN